MRKFLRRVFSVNVMGHVVFWSWNAIFLVVTLVGLLPFCIADLLAELGDGFVPWSLAAAGLTLLFLPAVTVALGAALFRRDPRRLLHLFYGFEAPLFLLALSRLFLVRELVPATAFLFLALSLSSSLWLWGLFRGARPAGRVAEYGRLIADGICLTVGLYLALLLLFYAVPVGWWLVEGFFRFGWLRGLWEVLVNTHGLGGLLALLGVLLFFFSASLFVALPVALFTLYLRRWRATRRAFALAQGPLRAAALTLLVPAFLVAGFLLANRQPQARAFHLLAEPPRDEAVRRALLAESETIRAGLQNAYLAPYRYPATVENADHLRWLYRETLHLSEGAAATVQSVFTGVARPFFYDGSADAAERRKAADLYAQFFDTPLQKGEKEAVLKALSATYDRDGREAGLLDEGERKVHLLRQEVSVDEQGDWAEVELHEVYQNRTHDDLEILYHFNLPESAVVTGLWLGDSDDRAARFAFTVAPRGAAQKVYKEEVERRVDPALVEQIGPRQYRLRAYPVPGRPWTIARSEARPLHLWLSYRVFLDGNAWPMPRLGERRNVYWDRHSERRLGGARWNVDRDEWLPARVPAAHPTAPQIHRALVDEGVTLVATPHSPPRSLTPPPGHYAVILDRSRSMGRHAAEVKLALAVLRDWLGDAHLYLTAAASRGEPPTRLEHLRSLDVSSLVYFGGQHPGELLRQFETLRAGASYDGVIVLTDEGALDLARDACAGARLAAPLWMVHLGGRLPAGYDDATLETIQTSGGGVTTIIDDALRGLAEAHTRPPGVIADVDGYTWSREPATAPALADPSPTDERFAALAARQYLVAGVRTRDLHDAGALDRLHAIARRHPMVSPYSSMIVLVNQAQRDRLAAAAAKDDRFQRTVESGENKLPIPSGGFTGELTATPEPEEWLLIAVATAAMLYLWRRRAGARMPVRRGG